MHRLPLVLLFFLAGCASTTTQTPPQLVGAWTLTETEAFDADGTSVYAPTVQTGLLILTESHYSLMWTRAPRPPAATPWAATEAERLARDATLIAHAGRYRVDGDALVMLPDAAKSPEFVGGSERFTVRLDGGALEMTAADARSLDGTVVPFYAAGGRQEYTYERASPAR